MVVEVCDSNQICAIDIEAILEREYPEVSVLKHHCLDLCGLCRLKPFALVNGTRVIGNTIEECLENIHEKIKEELADLL